MRSRSNFAKNYGVVFGGRDYRVAFASYPLSRPVNTGCVSYTSCFTRQSSPEPKISIVAFFVVLVLAGRGGNKV